MIFKAATKKIILVIVFSLIANFGLSLKQAKAQIPVTDVAHITVTTTHTVEDYVVNYIVKPLVRSLANALENRIVNSITSKISGAKTQQPSFITNWRNEILDSQARGNDVFRSVIADAVLCPYFDSNLKTAFGADRYAGALSSGNITNGGTLVYQNKTSIPGLPSFQNLSSCTLPADLNVNAFKNDFSKGGWAAWDELIKPQNNFFGVYSLALNEQAQQIQTEAQSSQNKSIAGQGYIGSNLGLNGASPNGCIGTGGINRCIFLGKEVTPPKLIADLNSTALGTKISRAGFGTELNDVLEGLIGAVITGLTQGLTNFAGQNGYNVAPTINGLFDQSGATGATSGTNPTNPPGVPANLQNIQTSATCRSNCLSEARQCTGNAVQGSATAQSCAENENACEASCP